MASQDDTISEPEAAGNGRTEALLNLISEYMVRARLDKSRVEGPVMSRAEGAWVEDTEGKRYLDFNCGQMSAALGHNHPRINEALSRAGATLLHASTSFFNEYELELGEKLASKVTAPLQKSYFLLSGADANEAAVGLARKYTGLFDIASPHISFHGYSDTAREFSFTSARKNYPIRADGTYALLAPYCYRCPLQSEFPGCGFACLDVSFQLLDAQTMTGLAGVITEPLFSAGGVVEPPDGWLERLQAMLRERGALLILDECQTGMAKLGTWFAHEQEGVVPDIMTLAKHFGGGVPISAMVTSREIEETVADLGFVFGHSNSSDPIGALAASAVLDVIDDEDLTARAAHIGHVFRGLLEELRERHELIGDLRGRGLIHGVELVNDRETREPASDIGGIVEDHCLEHGLILSLRGGGMERHQGHILRIVPPFCTTDEELGLAAEVLDDALTEAAGRR